MLHKIYLVLVAITRMIGIAMMLAGAYMSMLDIVAGVPSPDGFVPLVFGMLIIFSAKTIARFAIAGLD